MRAMKAVYGLWADIQIGQLNKLLKPFGCRLVKKSSKDWGQAVSITAHALEEVPVPRLTVPESSLPPASVEVCTNHTFQDHEGALAFCTECGIRRDEVVGA